MAQNPLIGLGLIGMAMYALQPKKEKETEVSFDGLLYGANACFPLPKGKSLWSTTAAIDLDDPCCTVIYCSENMKRRWWSPELKAKHPNGMAVDDWVRWMGELSKHDTVSGFVSDRLSDRETTVLYLLAPKGLDVPIREAVHIRIYASASPDDVWMAHIAVGFRDPEQADVMMKLAATIAAETDIITAIDEGKFHGQ